MRIVKLYFVKAEDEVGLPLLSVEALDLKSRLIAKAGSVREVGQWLVDQGFRYVAGSAAAWIQDGKVA